MSETIRKRDLALNYIQVYNDRFDLLTTDDFVQTELYKKLSRKLEIIKDDILGLVLLECGFYFNRENGYYEEIDC